MYYNVRIFDKTDVSFESGRESVINLTRLGSLAVSGTSNMIMGDQTCTVELHARCLSVCARVIW